MKPEIDPQAASAALLMASASPLLGKFAIILIAALFGGLVALSWLHDITKKDGAWFIFRSVGFATALTSISAEIISHYFTNIPAADFLFPVAFLIAVMGDRWGTILNKGIDLIPRGKKDDA